MIGYDQTVEDYDAGPTPANPKSVQVRDYSRNLIQFTDGSFLGFFLPQKNPYGGEQIHFSTPDKEATMFRERPKARAASVGGESTERCSCKQPQPDVNGNDAFTYGVSCAKCGDFLQEPMED